MQSVAGLGDIEPILLTHAHGDHYLGLPGMLQDVGRCASATCRSRCTGRPARARWCATLDPLIGRLPFPFAVVEIEPGGEVAGRRLPLRGRRRPCTAGRRCRWSLVEDERPGRFDVDEARRRGVPEGPLYGRLQRGEDVSCADGTVVRAAELVGEAAAGRRIVHVGRHAPVRRRAGGGASAPTC